MAKDFNISACGQFDLTKIVLNDVSVNDIAKGDAKLIKIFGNFDLNGDGTLNTMELASLLEYFSSFDKDSEGEGLGVISKNEFQEGTLRLNNDLELSGNDVVKTKDIKKFLENITLLMHNGEQADIDILLPFKEKYPELGFENLVSADAEDTLNGKKYVLKYKNGATVNLNPDKSYEIVTRDQNSNVTLSSYNAQNILAATLVTYNNGDTETTNFIQPQDCSEPVPEQKTVVTNCGQTTSVLTYNEGNLASEIVTTPDAVCKYIYDGSKLKLMNKTESSGGGHSERVSTFTYNDNGTVTVNIVEACRTITEVRMDDATNALLSEKRVERGKQGEVTTEIVYCEDGRFERVTTPTETTITEYNVDGYKINQLLMKDGHNDQLAEYDGEGNTYLVMTMYDKIGVMANKLGVEPGDIFDLNEELTHGRGNRRYFLAGSQIRVPGELNPDDVLLQGRGTSEYESGRYAQWYAEQRRLRAEAETEVQSRANSLSRTYTARGNSYEDLAKELYRREGVSNPTRYQISARAAELSRLNPNVSNGTLLNKILHIKWNPEYESRVSQGNIEQYRRQCADRQSQESREGRTVAYDFYKYLDEHSFATRDAEFQPLLRRVTPENIIGVIEQFKEIHPEHKDLLSFVHEEWGNTADAEQHIFDALKQRALNAGVSEANINNICASTNFITYITVTNRSTGGDSYQVPEYHFDKFETTARKIIDQIRLAESVSPEERRLLSRDNISTVPSTVQAMNLQYNIAEDNLEVQLAKDGWCADLWEGIKWLGSFGSSENLDENVRAELNAYRGYITQLQNAYSSGGMTAFKAKFKQIFGIEYDSTLAANYAVKMENYNKVMGVSEIQNSLNTALNSNNFNTILDEYANLLRKGDPSIQNPKDVIKQLLQEYMTKNGKAYRGDGGAQELASLKQMINTEILPKLEEQKHFYSRGKSVEALQAELAQDGRALFGTKHDVIERVNRYMQSQEAGAVYVNVGAKVLAMVAVGILTGGVGSAAVGTFLTSMTIDTTNELTGDGLTGDEFAGFVRSASCDALFAGASTYARDSIKAWKCGQIAKQSAIVTADTGIGTVSSTLKGNFSPGNVAYYALYSTLANVGSLSIPKLKANIGSSQVKLNFDRGFRRTVKGVDKERRAGNGSFGGKFNYVAETPEAQAAQISQLIVQVTNLGDLNALKRTLAQLPDEGIDKNLIAGMIENRVEELITNPHLMSSGHHSISPEIMNNAIAALNKPTKHLLPDEISDITVYITSISEPAVFYNVIRQLQNHGIDLTTPGDLRAVVDDKYAEFNQMPPYPVGEEFILYAHNSSNQNNPAESPTNRIGKPINLSNPIDLPTLNAFMECRDIPITMLDTQHFNYLKDELYNAANWMSAEELNAIMAQLINVPEQNQRTELEHIVQSIARSNGIILS